jgi:hypothetical protein
MISHDLHIPIQPQDQAETLPETLNHSNTVPTNEDHHQSLKAKITMRGSTLCRANEKQAASLLG